MRPAMPGNRCCLKPLIYDIAAIVYFSIGVEYLSIISRRYTNPVVFAYHRREVENENYVCPVYGLTYPVEHRVCSITTIYPFKAVGRKIIFVQGGLCGIETVKVL